MRIESYKPAVGEEVRVYWGGASIKRFRGVCMLRSTGQSLIRITHVYCPVKSGLQPRHNVGEEMFVPHFAIRPLTALEQLALAGED